MKIRTRLFLFLLPTLLASNFFIFALFAYHLHEGLNDKSFQNSLIILILGILCTIGLMVTSLYYIANRISNPIQKLNNSALAIAAGQYGESISVDGPKEIMELANTLNTMSECLLENINRLKENSLLRERMYGEYECAMLLQHMMLQKNIDDCKSDAVSIRSITFFSDSPRGLLLDFPKTEKTHLFHIHMAEAEEEGFEGMYQLLSEYKLSKDTYEKEHTSILFDLSQSTLHIKGQNQPLIWSLEEKQYQIVQEGPIQVQSGAYLDRKSTRLNSSHSQIS